ncbi:MAG: hypothetical protein RRZ84_04120 [Romboutsia sp.]
MIRYKSKPKPKPKKIISKTIYLEDVKNLKSINLKYKDDNPNNLDNETSPQASSNLISYNKIRRKHIGQKASQIFFKKGRPFVIFVSTIIIASLLSYTFNLNSKRRINSNSNITVFESVSPILSQTDFANYSSTISSSITKILKLSYNSRVVTESMHKNGDKIYAMGCFYIKDNKPIYFDIELNKNKPISLTINGLEYIR